MEQNYLQPDEKKKLPSGINVLTILTFVGCGVFGLITIFSPWINKFFLKFMDDAVNSGKELSEKQLADIERGKAMIELGMQNMVPLMVIGLAGIILCLVGALWMRKLKKDGFWLYTAGELGPLIATPFIMGFAQYKGIGGILSALVPIAFVIMYATQRKHLVN